MWEGEPDRRQRDAEPDWDTSWDPAIGKSPGRQRFQPTGRAKTIIVLVVIASMVATIVLLCMAAADLVSLILDPVAN